MNYKKRKIVFHRTIEPFVPKKLVPVIRNAYCWYKGMGDQKYIRETGYAYLPPVSLRNRVGSADISAFLKRGKECAQDIEAALRKHGKDFASLRHVLDFGCGCGRTLVWLRSYSKSCRLYGTDIDAEAIHWCQRLLDFAEFKINNPLPPLDFPQEFFDLVYALSVFTHMDEQYQFAWLGELKRIIKPKGVALISIHGSWSWQQLRSAEVTKLKETGIFFKPSRRWCWGGAPESYQTTYHTEEYILDVWSKYFKILDYIPRVGQDFVLLEAYE